MTIDDYYTKLFVADPSWSSPDPNQEEAVRWCKIAGFLENVVRHRRTEKPNSPLRILDVGCGRGWLTRLLSEYGVAEGLEPVARVVEHARTLFPAIRFSVGTPQTLLAQPHVPRYDVIVCSEVIEHVARAQQGSFIESVVRLLLPGGCLIITTPRQEARSQWERIAPPCQPIEDWVTEEQLAQLMTVHGLTVLGFDRIHVELPHLRYIPAPTPYDRRARQLLPLYQVWLAQHAADQPAVRRLRNYPPAVSVIVTTYNRPERLRTALASVMAQTFQDFEIIVVNDGGEAVDAVVRAADQHHRITLINHDRNRGLAAARNTGLRQAIGTYVCYLDDDDRFLPDHLETLVAHLHAHGSQVAYTDAWRVWEQTVDGAIVEVRRDRPYSEEFSPANLLVNNYIPVLCIMHHRACLEDCGWFDENLFVHEDWDLWIRLATRFPFTHIPKTTAEFTWRTDGSSMTSRDRDAFARTTEIIYRKYAPYVGNAPAILEAQRQRLHDLRAKNGAAVFTCSIVIPVWNKVKLTAQCLQALAGATTDVSYEVIVVDNGSTDETAEFLKQLQGDVHIIRNEENLGFAKACNQGARAARGRYVVFLNNDTIPLANWLAPLVREVEEHADVGVVGSKLLYADGTVQHAGVVFMRSHLSPYHVYRAASADLPAVNQRREFQAVTGACMLIRREVFEAVGGFDEAFVNGFEDVDLCLKVKDKGYHVIYQPRSVLYHLESQTPGRKARDEDNNRLLQDRWGERWWLGDEDLHYHTDGFKLIGGPQDVRFATRLAPMMDVYDHAAWAHVAAAQAAALKHDWAAVKRELALADDWPNDRFVLSWGAMVADRLEERTYRTRFLSRYLALVDDPAQRVALARTLLEQDSVAEADAQLRLALAALPEHPEGLLLQGVLHMRRGQHAEAERAFASALRQGADRRKCLMGMGMAALGRSYAQGAWERFLQVLAECPDDAEAIHWLLRAGTAQNRWEELSRHLEAYVARNPGDLAVRFAFAGVLLRADQLDAARRESQALRALAPTYDGLKELEQALAAKETALAVET